jgi:hypothetical protein
VLAPLLLLTMAVDGKPEPLFVPGGDGSLVFWSTPPLGGSTFDADAGVMKTARRELAGLAPGIFSSLPDLDCTKGFSVELDLQLLSEVHAGDDNKDGKADRAGFSVLVLDHSSRGIELAFWKDRIWAQSDHPLFTQAEGAPNDASAMHRYRLRVEGGRYVLQRDGKALLDGPVRDYTAFIGTPDVYHRKNFVFIGDDSTRSSASARIGRVQLTLSH